MREVILLVGVPGAGKTFVTDRLDGKYELCLNDEHIGKDYVRALMAASEGVGKPVLGECPFSVSQVKDPLVAAKRKVTPVFIIEDEKVLVSRYFKRDRKPIPPGHIARQKTYAKRAEETGAFSGTSEQVLEHLKGLV